MLTTKFIETSSSSLFACPCVRGNPSRRKLAEGRSEEFDGEEAEEGEAEMRPAAWVGLDPRYPRRESSPTMSLTMRESWTRPPFLMMDSASRPTTGHRD